MILGIMGGMGPAATCDIYNKIIQLTPATCDQEHLHIIIDSNSKIPDRTRYICGDGEDPRVEMVRSAIKLEMMGADYIIIPCNTAHNFYDDIVKYTKAKVLHMIRETASFLKKTKPEEKDYLLLATAGTCKSGIYKKVFREFDLNIIEPDEDDISVVMNWIYSVKSGQFNVTSEEFQNYVSKYMQNKEIPIILGCTELPLLADNIGIRSKCIDPVSILAKRCVEIYQEHVGESNI
ncbi:cysteate racemase [Lutispora thermophila]|uniref:Aspartate racemase n=1 Tax=Lutispora thermophila DSM 19022 TaxID=1122184 RepID=A0A1M6GK88_9FIRM|nr:amino acid racemase [Lutispora thermophila]SHJ10332.1 aspartate racemase [Lutispora thermophila DSM 19022]